jgi:hypothetical protein
VGDSEAYDQHYHADAERPATNSEELSEVALKDARPIGKISMEGFGQILCSLILGVAFWEMDDNSDELIGGLFTRPTTMNSSASRSRCRFRNGNGSKV